jgi:UDP-2,3-diacylglucosamine hydrolase
MDEPLCRFADPYSVENEVDYFIFGHYHVSVDMQLPSGARLYVLKDWMESSPYICFDGTDILDSSF